MENGISLQEEEKQEFQRGYAAGYRDGFADGTERRYGVVPDILDRTIHSLGLSTRARNCLLRAGCKCLRDVVNMSEAEIAGMKSLGIKTAEEIAETVTGQGIQHTVWDFYREACKDA